LGKGRGGVKWERRDIVEKNEKRTGRVWSFKKLSP